ncbi:MAG: universal stress protein [Thermoplasmata archaeon]
MTPLRTLVVGFDASPAASRAMALALAIATPVAARIVLVHAPEGGSIQAQPTTEEEAGAGEAAVAAAITGWEERARAAGVPFSVVMREEPPGAAILAVAREVRPELVVVGTRGLRPATKALLGSVSSLLLAEANRPVLVVP